MRLPKLIPYLNEWHQDHTQRDFSGCPLYPKSMAVTLHYDSGVELALHTRTQASEAPVGRRLAVGPTLSTRVHSFTKGSG